MLEKKFEDFYKRIKVPYYMIMAVGYSTLIPQAIGVLWGLLNG